MESGKYLKYRKITFNILIALMLISNFLLYRKSKKLENNANYILNISSSITVAAHANFMESLTSKFLPGDSDHLIDVFEEIKPLIGKQYDMRNYIAITYENGNTLMIKISRDKEGNFLIQDMFLLDKNIHDKLKHDKSYSNL